MTISIRPHWRRSASRTASSTSTASGRPRASGATWTHMHPATGEEVGRFPVAGVDDVDLAVRAARKAFDEGPWPRSPRQGADPARCGGIADAGARARRRAARACQALDNGVPLELRHHLRDVVGVRRRRASTTTPAGSTSSPARRCRRSRAATTW